MATLPIASTERGLNLLMVAYYFPPRGGSGVQRSAKFAKFLPEFGISPTVVTVSDKDITATRDESLLDDVHATEIVRVASGEDRIKTLGRLRLGPLVSATLRPDAHILWKRPVVKAVNELATTKKFDAIYVSVQPWSSAVIALKLKEKLGLPLIVDFRDPWIDSTSLSWPNRLYFQSDARWEHEIFRHADAVIGVTPGMIDCFRKRYPDATDRTHLIYNGFDLDDFDSQQKSPRPRSGADGKLKLAFAGRLYKTSAAKGTRGLKRLQQSLEHRNCQIDFTTHSLRYIVAAMGKLFKRCPEIRSQIVFDLAGNIPQDNRQLVQQHGLGDVFRFHGLVPHRDAIELIGASDVVFLPMMSEADGRRSFNASGKIFEYLAQCKPILGLVPEGDAADLIRNSGCGWVVDPSNVPGIADRLEQLIRAKLDGTLQTNVNRDFVASFDRRRETGQLAKIILKAAGVDQQRPLEPMGV